MLEGVNPRLIFAAVFVTGLAAFLWWDRNKVERHFILFYRRTDKGLEHIDKVAKKFPRLWNIYGWSGVILGLLTLVIFTVYMSYIFLEMFATQTLNEAFGLVLPGLGSGTESSLATGEPQGGALFIPIEYWVISIAILMFFHEMSHGVIARAEGFEINSVGWLVLGIIPGAFVEPKGEKMLPGSETDSSGSHTIWEGGDWKSRLKVLCAGSFANYLIAGIFLLLFFGFTTGISNYAFMDTEFVHYNAVEGGPAFEAGMTEGDLYSINGNEVDSIESLMELMQGVEPGDQVILNTSEGEFEFETTESEYIETGYMGINLGDQEFRESLEPYQSAITWFMLLLYFVGVLNFLIGAFNMLPIKPLDGGLSVETLITEFIGEEEVRYLNYFSLFGWALIIGTIIAAIIL